MTARTINVITGASNPALKETLRQSETVATYPLTPHGLGLAVRRAKEEKAARVAALGNLAGAGATLGVGDRVLSHPDMQDLIEDIEFETTKNFTVKAPRPYMTALANVLLRYFPESNEWPADVTGR